MPEAVNLPETVVGIHAVTDGSLVLHFTGTVELLRLPSIYGRCCPGPV